MVQTPIRGEASILLWNARSIRNKKEELTTLMKHWKTDISIITETWLKPTDKFTIPNFTIIRQDRTGHGGGVLIAIQCNMHIIKINKINNYNNLFQGLHIELNKFHIIGIIQITSLKCSGEPIFLSIIVNHISSWAILT